MEIDEQRYCYRYPHPAVTADCVVFGYDGRRLEVLLIKRANEPYKDCWAFPGGFVEIDESADDAARRELTEETGLRVGELTQFHTFSAPRRDPRERIITVAYYAVVDKCDVTGADDAKEARWFALDALPALAFDHAEILSAAVTAMRRDSHFGSIGCLDAAVIDRLTAIWQR